MNGVTATKLGSAIVVAASLSIAAGWSAASTSAGPVGSSTTIEPFEPVDTEPVVTEADPVDASTSTTTAETSTTTVTTPPQPTTTTMTVAATSTTTVPAVPTTATTSSGAVPAAATSTTRPAQIPQPPSWDYATYGDGTISLRIFDSPYGPISQYIIERADLSWSPLVWTRTTTTSRTPRLTGYVNGRTYALRIAAVNAAGQGPFANPEYIEPHSLWRPDVFEARPSSQSAFISWSASQYYTAAPDATTYRIFKRVGTGAWTFVTDVPFKRSVHDFRVTGLTNGVPTDLLVRAVFANGATTYGTIRVTPSTIPAAPTGLRLTAGGALVRLSWGTSPSNGGSSIRGYVAQSSLDGLHWQEPTLSYTSSWPGTPTQAYHFTGLSRSWAVHAYPGQRVWIRVAALNAAGRGPWSPALSVRALGFAGQPRDFRVTPQSRSARLRWNPPASTDGAGLLEYEVQIHLVGSPYWQSLGTTTRTDVVISGLTNGRRYCVRVWAWTGAGVGYPTTPTVFTAGSSSGVDTSGMSCR